MRLVWAFLMIVLPSGIKRRVANRFLGWDIHPTAYLGRSVVLVKHVSMGPGSSIGPLNVIRGIEELRLAEGASIATRNWVSGFPPDQPEFAHMPNRRGALILGKDAMITVGHELDCSDLVELEDYARLAGFRCQVLTHSLDLARNRFTTGPVILGRGCAVLSGVILTSGATVPAKSIVSAGSVVNQKLTQELTFYQGNPVVAVRELPPTLKYFQRGDLAIEEPTAD